MAQDWGKLLLRLTLGVLLLLHGIGKITGGVGFIGRMLEAHGLPAWIAYGAYVGEVLAPLLVIVGWYSRVGASVIVVHMLVVFGLAHRAELFALARSGAWTLEVQGFFLLTALVVALIGPGRYAVNRR